MVALGIVQWLNCQNFNGCTIKGWRTVCISKTLQRHERHGKTQRFTPFRPSASGSGRLGCPGSDLLSDPYYEAQLLVLVVSRDLPATKTRQIDTDHHKRLVFLLPTVTGTVGEENRWCRRVQSHPCDCELRRRLAANIVALPPPKQFLSKSRVIRRVMRQSFPCSVRAKSGPKLFCAKPKATRSYRDRALAGQKQPWGASLPDTSLAHRPASPPFPSPVSQRVVEVRPRLRCPKMLQARPVQQPMEIGKTFLRPQRGSPV